MTIEEKYKKIIKYFLNKTDEEVNAMTGEELSQTYGQILDNNISTIEDLQKQYNDASGNDSPMLAYDLLLWVIEQNDPVTLSVE